MTRRVLRFETHCSLVTGASSSWIWDCSWWVTSDDITVAGRILDAEIPFVTVVDLDEAVQICKWYQERPLLAQ